MKISSEQEMHALGQRLAAIAKGGATIELIGDVGAGKTTLTQGLAAGLGITEPVTSPSFTISRHYALPSGGELIHYDFYRLTDPGLMAEDLTESLRAPNVVVIEWAAAVADFLPEGHIRIEITNTGDAREVKITGTPENVV